MLVRFFYNSAEKVLSQTGLCRQLLILLTCLMAAVPLAAAERPLRVVGVLGNTSGTSDRPLPYAFYKGIALDGRGRLFLSGAAQGIVVCDQDGHCLAVLPLDDLPGYVPRSLLVRAGQSVFGVALAANGAKGACFASTHRLPTRRGSRRRASRQAPAIGRCPTRWMPRDV